MENNFDYKRFKKVFIKDIKSLWPRFGLSLLIIMLLPMAIWILKTSGTDEIMPNARLAMIDSAVILAAILAPSRLYKYCNTPNKGIHFAMLPASKSEKFWSMVLMTAIVVPLIAFCGMMLLDIILTFFGGAYREWIFTAFGPLSMEERIWMIIVTLVTFNAIPATFFFTATLFKKYKVARTFLWALLLGFILTILGINLLNFTFFDMMLNSTLKGISRVDSEVMFYCIYFPIVILWTMGFYYAAYYRLKRMKY